MYLILGAALAIVGVIFLFARAAIRARNGADARVPTVESYKFPTDDEPTLLVNTNGMPMIDGAVDVTGHGYGDTSFR